MPLRSERRYISPSNIKPGMMIEFSYTKVDGGGGSYMVLVVDPNKVNERASEPQLHGFIIKQLSDSELIEFFSSFRKTTKLDYDDRRGSIIEGLNTDEAYATFASSKYVKDRSYRTFNLSKMKQIRQVLLGSIDK
jgi:hypothetical protein